MSKKEQVVAADLKNYSGQYRQFENERTRPVRDLVAAIPAGDVKQAIDLGCGPGNSTEVLLARYPQATIGGVDASADMIASARTRLPQVQFDVVDIAAWAPDAQYDVILANASLQWLPDHETLFPDLLGKVTPGGHFAVQIPDNLDEPAHKLTREIAANGPWAAKLAGIKRTPRLSANRYYEVLAPHCRHIDMWRTTYFHVLQGGSDAVVEWFKGSALRPFLAALSGDEQEDFLTQYREGIARHYPALEDGTVLLPFPRLFMVATRR
ncbi:trans-aconitate 2-methyltransferase [Thalassospira marina]|uniref:Trans-aconitate 2-methyltransferase n=1 Tax=Thalassospira marina TaxID=2048283 RepID=A0ABM6Q5D8_9PROT|nr:trans-aconitate 2-methyltransferase [Thalassospira marina]